MISATEPAPGGADKPPPEELGDVFEMPLRAFEAFSQMVGSTASLVEKQLGLGITLAKFAEHTLLDVAQLRSAAPDALLPRVRADAHEFLDMFVDVMTMATNSLGSQALGIIDITSRAQAPPAPAASDHLVVVQMPGPPAPGQATERAIVMTNATDTPTAEMSFSSSDLLGPSGARIPSGAVSFNPPALLVAPRSSGRVVVRVTIPQDLPSGSYEGLLQGMRVEGQKTLLRVEVAEKRPRPNG
ncbi:MAG TPA: hypothetical protein VLM91_06490 [Candidatus Methylomirabilis sp.]|nr:hypothetical protein [Candidatus Methylomirabilis sp.]